MKNENDVFDFDNATGEHNEGEFFNFESMNNGELLSHVVPGADHDSEQEFIPKEGAVLEMEARGLTADQIGEGPDKAPPHWYGKWSNYTGYLQSKSIRG